VVLSVALRGSRAGIWPARAIAAEPHGTRTLAGAEAEAASPMTRKGDGMRKVLVLALVLGIALLSTSCYTLNYSASPSSRPVSFTGEVEGHRTHFKEEKWIWYALWGLVPISDTDIEKSLIEPRTAGGAVQNLSIRSEITGMNFLADVFTWILTMCSTTVTVEGDIVK
jgi:hypothetical protein